MVAPMISEYLGERVARELDALAVFAPAWRAEAERGVDQSGRSAQRDPGLLVGHLLVGSDVAQVDLDFLD